MRDCSHPHIVSSSFSEKVDHGSESLSRLSFDYSLIETAKIKSQVLHINTLKSSKTLTFFYILKL